MTAEEVAAIPGSDKPCDETTGSDACQKLVEHCREDVCPTVQKVVQEWTFENPDFVREEMAAAGLDPDLWDQDDACGLECTFEVTRQPAAVGECAGVCEDIQCEDLPDIPVDADGEPDLTNLKECTTFGIGGNCFTPETPVVCVDPRGDPPSLKGGVASAYFIPRTTGVLLEDSKLDVSIDDREFEVPLTGDVEFVGQPCPQQSCEIGFGVRAEAPTTEIGGIRIREGRLMGGSGVNRFVVDAAGAAVLPGGDATATMTMFLDDPDDDIPEKSTGFFDTNRSQIVFDIDWNARTFRMSDGFKLFDDPETFVKMQIVGELTGFPPRAEAGPDQTHECSVSGGAPVTLDGSASSDPDGDVISTAWTSGGVFGGDLVASERTTTIRAPLGETRYFLSVTDSRRQQSMDSTLVTVVDTAPPRIESFDFDGPSCLWAPNHKYAVLRVDRDFEANIRDACDPNPFLAIRGGRSSQPDNGIGDGDTENDVVVFPDHVCVRTERQGTDPAGREYVISLEARDASGNASDPEIRLRVPHDQREMRDQDCPDVTPVELVGANDPTCDPALARDAMRSFWAQNGSQAGPDLPSPDSEESACSTVPGSRDVPTSRFSFVVWTLLFFGVGISRCRRRR